MFIIGLGTAVPPHRYTQQQCWETLCAAAEYERLAPRSRAILRKVLGGHNGIVSRHLALDPLDEAFDLRPDALQARFQTHAPALAASAAQRAMQQADVEAAEIEALLISTCTGYLCPGLTSHVSERLRLRSDALALDLVGQGCAAALPNLRTAEALLASARCRTVLSICVEVCSAAFFLDDDPGVLISACLFGDGAGAAVLQCDPRPAARRVEWKQAETCLSVEHRDDLRFEQRGGMLRNILSKAVPGLAAQYSEIVLDRALSNSALGRRDISGWILHAAGRDVLSALQERLGLRTEDLRWSAAILRDHGNLSSASVLFALAAALAGEAPGGYWWMSSFGAGFTCHGALLKVD